MAAMRAPSFRLVDQHVARNPVARAIARRNVQAAVRDFSLRLYLLPDGHLVQEDAQAAAHVLMVALEIRAAQRDHDSADVRVMRGGISALTDIALRGYRWRQIDARAIDCALQRATAVFAAASATQVQDAWHTIEHHTAKTTP